MIFKNDVICEVSFKGSISGLDEKVVGYISKYLLDSDLNKFLIVKNRVFDNNRWKTTQSVIYKGEGVKVVMIKGGEVIEYDCDTLRPKEGIVEQKKAVI